MGAEAKKALFAINQLLSSCPLNSGSVEVRDRENWGENQPESLREIPPFQIIVDSRAVKGQISDTFTRA